MKILVIIGSLRKANTYHTVQKIEPADGVILASPNYVANVTWLMKNFIDRFAYTCHRPKYFNQKFMLLVTSGSYMGVKNVMKALSVMVSGGKLISQLSVFNYLTAWKIIDIIVSR